MEKVVLAYTGTLGSVLCIHLLRKRRGLQVITFSANLGQSESLEPLGDRAVAAGAAAAHIAECRSTFLEEYCFRALQGSALYQEGYPLFTALSRPLIVQELVRIAREEGAAYIAHGCSTVGNDSIRFEAAAAALAPHLKVLAPLQEYGCVTAEDRVRLAGRFGVRLEREPASSVQVQRNIWGSSVVRRQQLDPWEDVSDAAFELTRAPAEAPDEPAELTIGFEQGIPVSLSGERLEPVPLVERLNELGGLHGVGRVDMVEDNIGGIKSREIYEIPAAAILYQAHRALEGLVLGQELIQFKRGLAQKYSELVYYGLWFSELREALQAFVDSSQRYVTGEVRLRLFKGAVQIRGRRSPHSLYDAELARKGLGGLLGADLARRAFVDVSSPALKAGNTATDFLAE